ncbi:MAG: hypothetical protein HUJ73_06565 [Eubacterium sp.]|nr:hypothetical protein [Eubacterium sp.]
MMMKKKSAMASAAAITMAAVLLTGCGGSSSENAENAVPVMTVAQINSAESLGADNLYTGVVEAQETWSAEKKEDYKVEEKYVSVGDEVTKGQPLFRYDVTKMEEDQAQAEIDLEKLNNEMITLESTREELDKQLKKAQESDKADLNIRIQENELAIKQKDLEIRAKEVEIRKIKREQEGATVVSGIDGVVRKMDNNGSDESSGSDSNAYVTIVKNGAMKIKGTISEQNIGSIAVGSPMVIRSRVDDQTWYGSVSEINTNSTVDSSAGGYMMYGSGDSGSSKYHFYVLPENGEGLMIGQHVYLNVDDGTGGFEDPTAEGVWIPSYYTVQKEDGSVFVWKADEKGKLRRQSIEIEEYPELGKVEVLNGLSESDAIAYPDDSMTEGQPVYYGEHEVGFAGEMEMEAAMIE